MAEKHPKRPKDLNQWAKRMVEIATGETPDPTPELKVPGRAKGGKAGGPARAKSLSSDRRSEIAKDAAKARWIKTPK